MKQLFFLLTLAALTHTAFAQSWLLTGNSGTNPPTNFLGTKDATALLFKVNNQPSGYIDFAAGKANTSFGFQAFKNNTGSNNTAFGYKAAFSNTLGKNNTAAGAYALYFTTAGYSNSAVGIGALYKNAVGSNLVAVGDSALYNADGSGGNTAVGSKALYANTSGYLNTATGFQSLYSNTTGYSNIANGWQALYSNTTGNNNSAAGVNALYANTTGSFNSAYGSAALQSNQTGNSNTAGGYQALYANKASFNTATGYRALYTNTSGSFNAATGTYSMFNNTTGYSNAAYGYSSLQGNQTGYYNTAMGPLALFTNTTGNSNTGIGYRALYVNTTGSGNDAHGWEALYANTTGGFNVATGATSLYSNTTGNYNTAVGVNALYNNTASYYNCAVGFLALGYAIPGYNNVAVGSFSGPPTDYDDLYNTIGIGYAAQPTASNQARIGNSSTTSIGGYADWTKISDGRVKTNLKENVPGLLFINKLKPLTYTLNIDAAEKLVPPPAKKDKDGKALSVSAQERNARAAQEATVYTGFIAQEVEKAAKEINYNFSGVDAPENSKDLYGLRYAEFVVPLVKAVQELSAENEALKQRLDKMEALIKTQQQGSAIAASAAMTAVSGASLAQNIPNPAAQTTGISYTLPPGCSSAKIIITGTSGDTVKAVTVSDSKGVINIDTTTLAAGTYHYSLYINGGLAATRQMVIAK